MSLTSVRVIALTALFVETYIIGIIPLYLLQKWLRNRQSGARPPTTEEGEPLDPQHSLPYNIVIQTLLQFGGGVLFATVFVHLIPDTKKNFEMHLKTNESIFRNYETEDKIHRIPLVEIAICCGFFLIFIVEELMHYFLNRFNSHQKVHHACYNRDLANRCATICTESHESQIATETRPLSSRSAYISYGANMPSEASRKVTVNSCNSSSNVSAVCMTVDSNSRTSIIIKSDHNSNNEKDVTILLLCRGFVTIFAFSVHSIFDGLAIGLQNRISDLWSMFFAISVHKLVIAFVVSIQLFDQSKRLLLVAIHMAFFSVMSPIGILIVVLTENSLLEETSESNPIVILLISLATGTLLYIIFYEILQKDRCKSISGFVQFSAILVGFAVMTSINVFLSD